MNDNLTARSSAVARCRSDLAARLRAEVDRIVYEAFQDNWTAYADAIQPSDRDRLRHIYGWSRLIMAIEDLVCQLDPEEGAPGLWEGWDLVDHQAAEEREARLQAVVDRAEAARAPKLQEGQV